MTLEDRMLPIAQSGMDTLERFIRHLEDPIVLSRVVHAFVLTAFNGDSDLTRQMQTVVASLLDEHALRRSTESMLSIAIGDAILYRELAAAARHLASGIVPQDDIPSQECLTALLMLSISMGMDEVYARMLDLLSEPEELVED